MRRPARTSSCRTGSGDRIPGIPQLYSVENVFRDLLHHLVPSSGGQWRPFRHEARVSSQPDHVSRGHDPESEVTLSLSIDFSGWRPLRDTTQRQPTTDDDTQRRPLDDHFLTVPVAVETDAEHVLSESDLNMIRERVIANWRQKPLKSESFPHLRPLVDKLLPRPEVEKEVKEEAFKEEEEAASNE